MAQIYPSGDLGSLVDWSAGQLMPAPRANRPDRRETMYPVRCAECGAIRWLTRSDAIKADQERRICRRCQTSQAGKLGYAATVAAYGPDFAIKAVLAKQINSPSSYERLMREWIEQLTLDYEFQAEIHLPDPEGRTHSFILDFLLFTPRGNIAVEVNGWHHKRYRIERDVRLQRLYTGHVEFVDTDDMDTKPEAVKERLRSLLTQQ